MESKLRVDVDTSGQPQLKINYRHTDDLRDRLLGRFLDWMGIPAARRGFWAYVRLGHETQSQPNGAYDGAVVFIEPMNESTLEIHLPEMTALLRNDPKPPSLSDESHDYIGAPRSDHNVFPKKLPRFPIGNVLDLLTEALEANKTNNTEALESALNSLEEEIVAYQAMAESTPINNMP